MDQAKLAKMQQSVRIGKPHLDNSQSGGSSAQELVWEWLLTRVLAIIG